jgi:hypothetical protein
MREGEREGTEVREKTPDAPAIARRHNKRGPGREERGTRGEGGEPRKGVRGRREIPEEEKKRVERGRERGGASKKREDDGEQRDPRSLYSRLLGDGELVGVGQGSSKALRSAGKHLWPSVEKRD